MSIQLFVLKKMFHLRTRDTHWTAGISCPSHSRCN